MRRTLMGLVAVAIVGVSVLTASSQPPGGGGKGEKGGQPPGGVKGGFEPGRLLPPFLRDRLQLSDEQQKQVDALEKDVKERLMKILTADQKKQLEEMGRRGPGRPGEGDKGKQDKGKQKDGGRGKGKDKDKDGDRPPPPPPPPDEDRDPEARGGISWFSTLESGLAEAKRTGKPIMFMSAAPHCAGVSGIW